MHLLTTPYPLPSELTAFAADGTPDALFDRNAAAVIEPLGPNAYPHGLVAGDSGTVFLGFNVVSGERSDSSRVVAFGPDGALRPGWPFLGGSFILRMQAAPDGTIWVAMGTPGAVTPRLAVLDAGGGMLPGWPVLGPPSIRELAFDALGTAFFVSRPYGVDYLETIDRQP